MLIMMMREPPLPMPNVVIWSAIHMMNSVAEVMPITVMSWKPRPGFTTTCLRAATTPASWMPRRPASCTGFMSEMETSQACSTQMTMAR